MSKRSRKWILFAASLLLTLLFFELVFFVYYKSRGAVSARQLFKDYYYFNIFNEYNSEEGDECSWGDRLGPHPQFSFFYHHRPHCFQYDRNNYGFRGPDVPMAHDPNYFTVLVTGASVAELMAIYYADNGFQFEAYLNKHFISPTGKPFRVVNVALAGMAVPLINNQNMLFANIADAAISIQGYNEHFAYGGNDLIETPTEVWTGFAIRGEHPFLYMVYKQLTWWVRSARGEFFKFSYFNYFVTSRLTEIVAKQWSQAQRELNPYPHLPEDWTEAQNRAYFLERYAFYLKVAVQTYKVQGVPYLLFIQPAPHYYKKLTAEEESVIGHMNTDRYKDIFEFLENLPQSEVPHESLLKIYENYPETLYIDHIHTNEKGMDIMIEEISQRMAQRYGWKRKKI